MLIPHQTLNFSFSMNFTYFDIFGIVGLLGKIGILPASLSQGFSLMNTHWPMILLSLGGLAFKNGLYIFMLKQFFMGVPDELEESAYIDGSGVYRTFIQIILPLSVPMMVTVFMFAFCWQWTDDFYTNLFYTTAKMKLMPKIVDIPTSLVTDYAGKNLYEAAIKNTCGILIIAPLIVLYAFGQKFLVQGIERSGLTAD
jgi:multiple sugar transport system permease protein